MKAWVSPPDPALFSRAHTPRMLFRCFDFAGIELFVRRLRHRTRGDGSPPCPSRSGGLECRKPPRRRIGPLGPSATGWRCWGACSRYTGFWEGPPSLSVAWSRAARLLPEENLGLPSSAVYRIHAAVCRTAAAASRSSAGMSVAEDIGSYRVVSCAALKTEDVLNSRRCDV